ncbi:Vacuolar protein sorting-associated protein 5 [Quaeritorhiza haematococci]|nr:Vacuolar protein sorting-associated protein 5 [Quaeritorhiza haematococci]
MNGEDGLDPFLANHWEDHPSVAIFDSTPTSTQPPQQQQKPSAPLQPALSAGFAELSLSDSTPTTTTATISSQTKAQNFFADDVHDPFTAAKSTSAFNGNNNNNGVNENTAADRKAALSALLDTQSSEKGVLSRDPFAALTSSSLGSSSSTTVTPSFQQKRSSIVSATTTSTSLSSSFVGSTSPARRPSPYKPPSSSPSTSSNSTSSPALKFAETLPVADDPLTALLAAAEDISTTTDTAPAPATTTAALPPLASSNKPRSTIAAELESQEAILDARSSPSSHFFAPAPITAPAQSASVDNASIVPIAPSDRSEKGTLYDNSSDVEDVLGSHGGNINPGLGYGNTTRAVTTPLSVSTIPPLGSMVEPTDAAASVFEPESRRRDVVFFEIHVTEPQKVGDVVSAHVLYKVKTRTNSTMYKTTSCAVNRRYRDFLWLYNTLVSKYPGLVVPPVPEKHALGRFQDEFVESRRAALERCLRKMAAHPVLQNDDDLRLFLESETFSSDKKKEESKSFIKGLGDALSNATQLSFSKTTEIDQAFESKKNKLEILETQLRALLRAIEGLVRQRKELGSAALEFGESVLSLANIEVDRPLSRNLTVLGNIHKKVKELHEKQAKYDFNFLAATIDEYIRLIGSIKVAFSAREKAFQTWQTAETSLAKKRDALLRLKAASKTRSDKIASVGAEIEECERAVSSTKKEFDDISEVLRSELDRVDREKVADFARAMKGFLGALMESQREIVSAWETYFKETNPDAAPAASIATSPVPPGFDSHQQWQQNPPGSPPLPVGSGSGSGSGFLAPPLPTM